VVFVVACLALPAIAADRPPIELPVELRHENYARGGSCAYAAAEDLLSLQGRDDLARYVRAHYAGGVALWPGNHVSLLDLAESLGLSYDFTTGDGKTADAHWLQCASDQGLGAVVHWWGRDRFGRLMYGIHAVTFLGFDGDGFAWILDNNAPAAYRRIVRQEFLTIWCRSGGDAFTFVLPPKE
jgi:hypothetical protein